MGTVNYSRVGNEALLEALRKADLTYEQLAMDVRGVAAEAGDTLRTNRSAVAHWIKGQAPNPKTAAYIAKAISRRIGQQLQPSDLGLGTPEQDGDLAEFGLGLGPDPINVLQRIGEADIKRRHFLTNATYSVAAAALPLGMEQAREHQQRAHKGQRAGQAEITAVRDMITMFTKIDERHGGQHGRTAVAQYLRSDVADLCRASFTSQAHRSEALSTAACVAYLCGWKAYDAAEHGLAQRYYHQALALTRDAGDELHGAWQLRILAHNGMDVQRPAHTLQLAEAALARVQGRVDPITEALFAVTRARALATAHRGTEAAAQIRQAQDLVSRGEPEALPFWASLWGSPQATVASHTAKTFRALGDHANAEKHYATSARSRSADGHQRITALTLAARGREQSAQGHLERACSTWGRSMDLFGGVRSARANEEVRNIRQQLTVFEQRGIRAAAELDERARLWQLSHQ